MWQATLSHADGRVQAVTARALVNAAGPWAAQFLAEHVRSVPVRALRLVKGSHIVVPRLFDHGYAYIFQNPDKRIIFAIPYEEAFTLVGTTDVEHRGEIGGARADAEEVAYLCAQASRYFARPVTAGDVVHSYAGVRPLLEDESGDPSAVTRDYSIELDIAAAAAPLLNVWGGKRTTYRKIAEEAADLLGAALQARGGAWTRDAVLPGGDLAAAVGETRHSAAVFERFAQALAARHADMPPPVLRRMARAYGTRIGEVLGIGTRGAEVAPGLFECELAYLHDAEWARTADDVLWRRTKLGLHLGPAGRDAVVAWCHARWHGRVPREPQPRCGAAT